MHAFQFQTTKSILCEVGATAKIGGLMADMGCKKVAFVTDEMILKLGLADAALAPRLVAGALVEESLTKDEALGPDVVEAFLILFAGLGLYLLELDLWIFGRGGRM